MNVTEYKATLDRAVRLAHEGHNYLAEEEYQNLFGPLKLTEEQDALTRQYFETLNIKFGEWDGEEEIDLPLDSENGNYLKFYLEELRELPKYSPEEKKAIIHSVYAGNDDEAKSKLLNMYLEDVVDIAKLYVYHGMRLEDLIGEGNIGLMMAVDLLVTLDSEDEVDGFIGKTVMDAMDAAINRDNEERDRMDKVVEKITEIGKAAKELAAELRRDVTPEELVDENEQFTLEDVIEAIRLTGNHIEGLAGGHIAE
ncbi:hypothetical protein SAMN06296386_10332 [Lachnospiraceae bacterium]|nr:hypothetical protein SAMN06296386_10332 [Lachnospiraceae bacterium]